MPIHDWTRVEAGIFHAFHHQWIAEISKALNGGLLPADYYALAEQITSGYGPDVLTLQQQSPMMDDRPKDQDLPPSNGGVLIAPPKLQPSAESDLEYYRRKQKVVAIRHVSDDQIVAIIEIVSPGNKSGKKPLRTFIDKAATLLDRGVHLLIVDVLPPGRRDPNGIHGEIWEEVTGQEYQLPKDRPLMSMAYECGIGLRAYLYPTAVGQTLADTPLFLDEQKATYVPLEATYEAAYAAVPRRWQKVLEAQKS